MDVAFQKSFFINDFNDELRSPIFDSDDTLNHTIRWIFETKVWLLLITFISSFNLIVHTIVMIMWYNHGEMLYFWFAFAILLLHSCGNTLIMTKYIINNSCTDASRFFQIFFCFSCLPFGIIFPYILMTIPESYFTQIDDVDDSHTTDSEHRLFTKKNRKFVSAIIEGYTQGIPQSILMSICLYNIGNGFNMFIIKLNIFSSLLVIIQSLLMWKLTKFLDKMYNIINIICAVIDIIMIYIMILLYYRDIPFDVMIFNIWMTNSIVGMSFIFIFILSYMVLMQCWMMPQLNGFCEYFGFCCCFSCFVFIPYPIIASIILFAMEIMTYSWLIVFIRMFCVGTNWKFIQFIIGTHLHCCKKRKLTKKHKIYRLHHVNHMLTTAADGKTDIEMKQFELYLDNKYEENKFIGIDSLKEMNKYSWKEKLNIIDKCYNDYVYGVLGVDASNGAIYKYHKPFSTIIIAVYFVTRLFKLFLPFPVFIGVVINYNEKLNGTDFLLYIVCIEMLLIVIVIVLLVICIQQIYYGFHVIYSTPHNKIYARSYIQFLAVHRVLSGIVGNEDIARIIILFCGHLQKITPNCPAKHGLQEAKSGGFHMCDICRQTINVGDTMHSCRKCDFDACQECFKTNHDDGDDDDVAFILKI